MKPFGVIAYLGSALLFAVFVTNLVLARSGVPMFGTSAEALTLFAAAGLFGAGTLVDEMRSRN